MPDFEDSGFGFAWQRMLRGRGPNFTIIKNDLSVASCDEVGRENVAWIRERPCSVVRDIRDGSVLRVRGCHLEGMRPEDREWWQRAEHHNCFERDQVVEIGWQLEDREVISGRTAGGSVSPRWKSVVLTPMYHR